MENRCQTNAKEDILSPFHPFQVVSSGISGSTKIKYGAPYIVRNLHLMYDRNITHNNKVGAVAVYSRAKCHDINEKNCPTFILK